jgi:hypothetical protein
LVLRESSDEGREARFMDFIIKPGLVPSFKTTLHGKVEEITTRVSLDVYTANNLSVSDTVMKVWRYCEESFAQMHEDHNLENQIRVEVNQFNLVVVQETVKEFIGWKAKSALKEGG